MIGTVLKACLPMHQIAAILLFFASLAASFGHDSSRPQAHAKEGDLKANATTAQDDSCSLTIKLLDSETGELLPGIVRLLDSEGTPLPLPELQDRCVGLPRNFRKLGWYTLIEPTAVSVPSTIITVEAVSGLETEGQSESVNLTEKTEAALSFELKRFWKASEHGLVAGNTHLHLKDLTRQEADRYLQEVPRGDGLEMVFVSYLERALVDRTYITNEHSKADLHALSREDGLRFGNGEEYRHNIEGGGEGYGHVMFLDLDQRILPASVGPGITKQGDDGQPLRHGIEAARKQAATVVWCHNGLGFEDLPSWVSGLVDAQNIFDGGNQGSYEDTFYRYLDIGLEVPFSTGTDWFIYDYSRVYADLGENKNLTIENWLSALRLGKTFITNGPFLDLQVGVQRAKPGSRIQQAKATTLPIHGRAIGRHDFGTLEVILNGKVIATEKCRQIEGHYVAEIEAEAELSQSGWIALRITPSNAITNELGRPLFAHTSAVTVLVDGRPIFNPSTGRKIIAEIENDLDVIRAKATFPNKAEKAKLERIYLDAIADLQKRLKTSSQVQ